MKKLIFLFCFISLSISYTNAQSDNNTTATPEEAVVSNAPRERTPEQQAAQRVKGFKMRVSDLTTEQEQKIYNAYLEDIKAKEDIQNTKYAENEQRYKKMAEQNTKTKEKVMAILTPTQLEKYSAPRTQNGGMKNEVVPVKKKTVEKTQPEPMKIVPGSKN